MGSVANRKPKINRREAFRAAASELDATFVAGKSPFDDAVHLEHGPWKVILDTYAMNNGQNPITYTRLRALYVAKEDFTLRISQRNIFTGIAELFGFHGPPIGDREFEHKYKIKCSNKAGGRSLMIDRRLRELIMVQPSLQLELRRLPWGKRRKHGDGVRAVVVQTAGVIKDPDRLVQYLLLVAGILDQLLRTGGAFDGPVTEGRIHTLPRRG